MDLEQEALDRKWDDVRKAELAEIAVRRDKAELSNGDLAGPTPANPQDLVGLALSGGGIRSASFNLGVLQALVESGLFRYLDFLSTVSGGGYIGSFISSLAYRQHLRRALAKDTPAATAKYEPPPIAPRADGSQPDDTKSLAKNSNFLNDKLEALSRYLIGMFLNFITLFSGLVFASTIVAILWRGLDMPFIVDFLFLYSHGFILEWNRPFLPGLFVFGLWVGSWIWSSFWKGSVATARNSGKFLVLSAVFLLIGLAIWLGTPNMNLSALGPASDAHHQSFWNAHQHLLTPILVGWIATMLPFLNPRQLLKSGTDTKSMWKGWLFQIAGYSMVVGIPFATVWFIGRHNLSLVANGWERDLVASDIVDWELFWKQVRREHATGQAPGETLFNNLNAVGGIQDTPLQRLKEDTELYRLQKPNYTELSDQTIGQYYTGVHAKNHVMFLMNKAMDADPFEALLKCEKEEADAEALINQIPSVLSDLRELQRSGEFRRLHFSRGDLVIEQSDLHDLMDALKVLHDRRKKRLAQHEALKAKPGAATIDDLDEKINKDKGSLVSVDKTLDLLDRFRLLSYPFLADTRKKLKDILQNSESADAYAIQEARAFQQMYDRYRFYAISVPEWSGDIPATDKSRAKEARDLWMTNEFKRHTANHLLLRLFYPTHLRPIQLASRPIVIIPDQKVRLWILLGSGLAFFLLGSLINFNWTSLHGFYRRRIQRTFLVRHAMSDDDKEHREIDLKALANTLQGYPYHILTGTVELVTEDRDAPPQMAAFQFARLFCGGRELDFCATAAFRQGKMSLSSAAAISGAALSPTRIRYLLLQIMLTVTNLRLGQWLPNPSKNNSLVLPSRYVPLLRLFLSHLRAGGVTRDLAEVFVTDGGHYENLGIDMLLDRRCRLIFASDAGADPTFEYADLANLFAIAARKGIRFVQFNPADTTFDREITLESVQTEFKEGNQVVLWKIHYPEGDAKPGLCVYMKSSLPKPQPFESGQFKLWNEEFPHDSTANQFFHEQQFEVYRSLGYYLAQNMLRRLQFDDSRQAKKPINVDGLMEKGVFSAFI